MAGDFNNVEDKLDRLPPAEPDASLTELDTLKASLGLMIADGWRVTNPSEKAYTFFRGSGAEATCSRLDRIYTTAEMFPRCREWEIRVPAVKTDHSLVTVQVTTENAPTTGKGRPTFPLHLLKNKSLARDMKSAGIKALNQAAALESGNARTPEQNAQSILHALKSRWMELARTKERECVPKQLAELKELRDEKTRVQRDRTMTDAKRAAALASLTEQIKSRELKRAHQQQRGSKAKHRIDGERPTKYWTKLHQDCAPRDTIPAFEKEGGEDGGDLQNREYENDTAAMAKMARDYHENIQNDERRLPQGEERERCIKETLESLDVKLDGQQIEAMAAPITYEECGLALQYSKNGTAPGKDGLPYEVWKTLQQRFIEDSRHEGRSSFDVVKLLHLTMTDVQKYGVSESVPFAEGWMAPIYKEKGERTKIANYRPITLLNTDYKLLSKVLSIRLAEAAPTLVHDSQAGFVPGRKLHNHTQLAKLMISWAERTETNGTILALDQEKAYDKIAHDYLWRVLAKLGMPDSFTNIVKSLYANAETEVMINGVLSAPYKVTRGVRQGDPLSCLLFNLAIEPLSAMIRKSNIKGINIPNLREALKATLFADDTTTFLGEDDKYQDLQKVLDTWCGAAKARFNIKKTEIIPIGTAEFRKSVIDDYKQHGRWKDYPLNVHVMEDGEPVRILGAWLGNNLDNAEIWLPRIEKIRSTLEKWTRSRPTLEGKRHVVQMFAGGMSQFLADVQRMPKSVIDRLNVIIRRYLWNDKHTPPVKSETMLLPVEQGGFGILDLEARNDAIDVNWLKEYLNFEKRPTWALLADDIFAQAVPTKCVPPERELRVNPFLQHWTPTRNKLPEELKAIVDAARKWGLRLEGRAISRTILRALPMWDHIQADRTKIRSLASKSAASACLKHRHGLRTVGDFEMLAVEQYDPGHSVRGTCNCDRCTYLKMDLHCKNPQACYSRAAEFLNMLPQKWDPRGEHPEDYEGDLAREAAALFENEEQGDIEIFDRTVTVHGTISDALRLFTATEDVCPRLPDISVHQSAGIIRAATDGSCLRNGERNAQAGAGVFFGPNSADNISVRLPASIEQTNQTGEGVATLLATSRASTEAHLIHITDSKTTMAAVTTRRRRYEDEGFIRQKNSELTRAIIAASLARPTFAAFRWVKGHNGDPANEAADVLAGLGAAKQVSDVVGLEVPVDLALTGAKLSVITQELAYKAIRQRKAKKAQPRARTANRVARILDDIEDDYSIQVSEEQLWRSLKRSSVTREARQWLWMVIHDAYMVGTHWLRPNMRTELQERASCKLGGSAFGI
ncbi:hypothetical protein BN946_scf184814.g4 [Trametes cinnabarina]|uniref:RNase H type-1 domain-containing protein n=1 Tax=Pycnoporus cinnabarinus TaxID=5643 RepID=A0A060SPG5_PYCCI|nr:hypothetical protein BN946_scf184814.g4 [Trametes cinnabarina]